jgi:hypothetical protein
MEGFISIHRRIKEHWIVENSDYFKAWLFMLLITNFKDGKLLLGGKVYTIKRGQSSLSMRSWAYEFKMSVKAVDTFFDLLVAESMIKREVIGKGKHSTTLVTIENYDSYQHVSETLEKRKGIARETLENHKGNAKGVQYNNVNKDNNVNKENNKYIPSFEEFLKYAIEKKPKVSKSDVKLKYESWIENDWKDGKDNKISNWKTKLLNTLSYLKEEVTFAPPKISV